MEKARGTASKETEPLPLIQRQLLPRALLAVHSGVLFSLCPKESSLS